MSYKIVSQYAITCGKCGKDRSMVDVEHDLGSTMTVIARWCACPIEELVRLSSEALDEAAALNAHHEAESGKPRHGKR